MTTTTPQPAPRRYSPTLELALSTDDARTHLTKVHVRDGLAIATDGHRLHVAAYPNEPNTADRFGKGAADLWRRAVEAPRSVLGPPITAKLVEEILHYWSAKTELIWVPSKGVQVSPYQSDAMQQRATKRKLNPKQSAWITDALPYVHGWDQFGVNLRYLHDALLHARGEASVTHAGKQDETSTPFVIENTSGPVALVMWVRV